MSLEPHWFSTMWAVYIFAGLALTTFASLILWVNYLKGRGLLGDVCSKLAQGGWVVGNVDITVIAQQPRLSDFIENMRATIAEDLGIDASRVNVKATTTERLGFVGREEGIAAHAVALIMSGDHAA